MPTNYPTYEAHRHAWEELALGIAALKPQVHALAEASAPPNSKPGSLTIIGSGIETIGFSVGDVRLLEEADKVLFCVADPATIVYIKKLRPDALDLYVLYGENKIRYTTYMQMTEAQLYWVRQGLNVVVVFYGHPGVFVLSTHRAIKLARREGHRALMKAGVCALDTLCADLGVDPSHPGMQTFEATDCLTRQRTIDTSLHVVLWQVGLIGELGYRRQGYLNTNFSYFICWLQRIYGNDYPITHYIGSRYPTIPPQIEIYPLSALHHPDTAMRITGLSTFYLAPRDVVPTHYQTALDLGIISAGQQVVPPITPLREIGQYGPRELKAFDAFAHFSIPPSYKWQPETEASNFLIALRFDTHLQELYEKDPGQALADPRFSKMTERERDLLLSRDAGAIQIASKGIHYRSLGTEKTLSDLLNQKEKAAALLRRLANLPRIEARQKLDNWLVEQDQQLEWPLLQQSVDYVQQNQLFPWTGVYLDTNIELVITLIGHGQDRRKSILYINNRQIAHFGYENGVIRFFADIAQPYNGFLRPDVDRNSCRRILGKIWLSGQPLPDANNCMAIEVDPESRQLAPTTAILLHQPDSAQVYGQYAVRTSGDHSKQVNRFMLSASSLHINGKAVESFSYFKGRLKWSGGEGACYQGTCTLIIDPIIHSIELFGQAAPQEGAQVKCYGSSISAEPPLYRGPLLPTWAAQHLAAIAYANSSRGGLLLWHKWEKHHFTSRFVNKTLYNLA